jgi:hypothetical protein
VIGHPSSVAAQFSTNAQHEPRAILNQFGCGNKVLQPRFWVISVVAVSLCYRIRTHGAHRKQNGVSTGRFLNLRGCIVQDPTAPWAVISTPRSEEKSIFDFEVELC